MRFFDSQDFQIVLLSLNVLLNPGNVMSTNTPAEFFVFSSNFLIVSLHYLNSFTALAGSIRIGWTLKSQLYLNISGFGQ